MCASTLVVDSVLEVLHLVPWSFYSCRPTSIFFILAKALSLLERAFFNRLNLISLVSVHLEMINCLFVSHSLLE